MEDEKGIDRRTTTVTAVSLCNGQTRVSIGQRHCVMEDQLEQNKQLAKLCPTEMLAATIAG